jgi:GNAT superfamily N-acetyltransferase
MPESLIRPAEPRDEAAWRRLWAGYLRFYRAEVPEAATAATWARLLDADSDMACLLAEKDGQVIGICNYLFHASTWSTQPICYLQDLYVDRDARGTDAARALILACEPFAAFEWMIAWRYLRARRAEGGVSVMTWISLIGITLAVFALIATLAVRSGSGPSSSTRSWAPMPMRRLCRRDRRPPTGQHPRASTITTRWPNGWPRCPASPARRPGARAGDGQPRRPLGRGRGVRHRAADLMTIPRVAGAEAARGDIARFDEGIAIGSGVARELNGVGDRIRLISPDGVQTAFGTSPRINAYEVVYIFTAGRWDIDRTRVYMPFAEAQSYFNRDGWPTRSR